MVVFVRFRNCTKRQSEFSRGAGQVHRVLEWSWQLA